MKRMYSIELHIARKGDKLIFHLKKWKKLVEVYKCIMASLYYAVFVSK